LNLQGKENGAMLLDIGCGSGISGEVLSEGGHYWVGLDISPHMLLVAKERETEGDMLLSDVGQGFKFRPGSFDGAISISAIQWLANRDKKCHNPYNRCRAFFQSLFNCLTQGARAVLQFYPESANALEMITSAAMRSGFSGGVVVDFPHSAKAKKYFLVITAGVCPKMKTPDDLNGLALTGDNVNYDGMFSKKGDGQNPDADDGMSVDGEGDSDEDSEDAMETRSKAPALTNVGTAVTNRTQVQVLGRDTKEIKKKQVRKKGKKLKEGGYKSKEWILKKKVQMRARGRDVAKNSKFTGRSRKPRF